MLSLYYAVKNDQTSLISAKCSIRFKRCACSFSFYGHNKETIRLITNRNVDSFYTYYLVDLNNFEFLKLSIEVEGFIYLSFIQCKLALMRPKLSIV